MAIMHISVPKTSGPPFYYSYYTQFEDYKFKYDLIQVCFHVAEIFDNTHILILPNECSLM